MRRRFDLPLVANRYSPKEMYLPLLIQWLLEGWRATHLKVLLWSEASCRQWRWARSSLFLSAFSSFFFHDQVIMFSLQRIVLSFKLISASHRASDGLTVLQRDRISHVLPSPGMGVALRNNVSTFSRWGHWSLYALLQLHPGGGRQRLLHTGRVWLGV